MMNNVGILKWSIHSFSHSIRPWISSRLLQTIPNPLCIFLMRKIMSRFQHNSVKRDESNKLYKVWINWRASCNILHPKNVSRNSLKNQMFLSRFLSFHRRIIIITYKSPNKRRDSIIDTNVNNRRVQAFWELGCILVDLYVIISSIPNNKIKKGKTHKRFFFG